MIKVIAFDLVGVLVREKNIEMTPEEEKLERLFGPNKSDSEYLIEARKIIPKDVVAMRTTLNILNNLYEVKDKKLLSKLREKYPDIKIIIVTNHLSRIRNFIGEALGVQNIDKIFISADIHKIKPNRDFYEEVIDKMNCKPEEILFLDDNKENVSGAELSGMKAIKVNKEMNLYEEINLWFEENQK